MKPFSSAPTRLLFRWLLGLLLVALVLASLDTGVLLRELSQVSMPALTLAFVLTVLQVLLSAWRWRYTVSRLGLALPYRQAVLEYYLSTFLNQVMPGGVLGDVGRAWRHGTSSGERLKAAHGVAIERLSGQLVLVLVVLCAGAWLFSSGLIPSGLFDSFDSVGAWLLGVCASLALLAGGLGLVGRFNDYFRRLNSDVRVALVSWPALPVQIGTSLAVLASYLGVFLILAASAGYLEDSGSVLLTGALGSLLLLSMVVPVTVAGWGVREGVAALIWPLAGLPAEQGVALSVAYGVANLLASSPGLLVLVSANAGGESSRYRSTG